MREEERVKIRTKRRVKIEKKKKCWRRKKSENILKGEKLQEKGHGGKCVRESKEIKES